MSGKKIIISNLAVSAKTDDIAAANDSKTLATGLAYDRVYKGLVESVINLRNNPISITNERLILLLDNLQLIIDNNNTNLDRILSNDLSVLRAVLDRGNAIRTDMVSSTFQSNTIATQSIINEAEIVQLEQYVLALIENVEVSDIITVGGDINKFYPMWWDFPTDSIGTVQIERNNALTTNYIDPDLTVFFKCRGIGSGMLDYEPHELRIENFTEINGPCVRLISKAIFNTPEGLDPVQYGSYSCPLGNCLFLRGATQYKVTCSDISILNSIQSCVNNISPLITQDIEGHIYRIEPVNEIIVDSIKSDPRLKWLFLGQQNIYTDRVVAPSFITVPVESLSSDYSIVWGASSTLDVTYILEQATNALFTDAVVIYSGFDLQLDFIDHAPGTFYYRVRADKAGISGSRNVIGTNSCNVIKFLVPPTELILPAVSSRDGEITISWDGELSTNAQFVVEHASSDDFVDAVALITTTDRTITTSQFPQGDRYFRVKIIRSNYTDSTYLEDTTPVDITIYAHDPSNIVVPDINTSGTVIVTWDASDTVGATYILERSLTNDFSTDVTQIPVMVNSYTNIDLLTYEYYFRVKAVLPGVMTDSNWLTGSNSCIVTRTIIAPATLTVPVTINDGEIPLVVEASTTPDISEYVIEVSTTSDFSSDVSEVYIGLELMLIISLYDPNVYYFRVKASKFGWVDSNWTNGSNGCNATRTVETPASLTLPVNNTDGAITLNIGESSTLDITEYIVEHSLESDFSSDVSIVYSGLNLSINLTDLEPGTHYYRAHAVKPTWIDSDYRIGTNPCVVVRTVETIPSLTVPVSNEDGNILLTSEASATSVDAYVFEMSTVSDFSSDVEVVYTGIELTPIILNVDPGIYYFRVKGIRSTWVDSVYTEAINTCNIVRTIVMPILTIPTNITHGDGPGLINIPVTISDITPDAEYHVDISKESDFAFDVITFDVGTDLSPIITTPDPGIYYFRVIGTKPAWINSDYGIGSNACTITRGVQPIPVLDVPATDADGTIILTITETPTEDIDSYTVLMSTTEDFSSNVLPIYVGLNLNVEVNNLVSGTYYFRIKGSKTDWIDSVWTNGSNTCVMTRTVIAPSSMSVPTDNDAGIAILNIIPSSTPGVEAYVVEMSTVDDFSSEVTVEYIGSNLTPSIMNLVPGTYYFRVKAIKTDWVDSTWTEGENECVITRTVETPVSLTVPELDEVDGIIELTINESITLNVTEYVIETSSFSDFSSGVSVVYEGLDLTPTITNLLPGTHYFRVKAVKIDWSDSNYRNGNVGCIVSRTAVAPATLTIPENNGTGEIPVVIGASITPDISEYVIEASTDINFSNDVNVLYTGLNLTPTLSIYAPGVYYFRAKANKVDWVDSLWTVGDTACTLTRTVEAPISFTTPENDSDGDITLTIGPSPTADITSYIVEQSLVSDFSSGVDVVYEGLNLIIELTDLYPNTYYYRVTATKNNWIDSNTVIGNNECVITRTVEIPVWLTVPTDDQDGYITIEIVPSLTPDVEAYVLEMSTTSDFSLDVSVAYEGLSLAPELMDIYPGTYYFRVKGSKTGWSDSDWTDGDTECIITRTIVNPTLTIPATRVHGDGAGDVVIPVAIGASTTPEVEYHIDISDTVDFSANVVTFDVGSNLNPTIITYDPGTYYFRVIATKATWINSDYVDGDTDCVVTRGIQPVPVFTIPPTDGDGTITLTITPTPTSGVEAYEVEMSLISDFSSGVSVIYTGLDLTPDVNNLDPGAYYFRVKSYKTGWIESVWTNGSNACAMERTVVAPASLTVPASDAIDGIIDLTIGVSTTPDVTEYIVETSLYSDFSSGVSIVYIGLDLTPTITGLLPGTHYFRVRADKTEWIDSGYTVGNTSCIVTRTVEVPVSLVVPANDADGSITLTIGASTTPGIDAYVVEQSLASDFSSGVSTAYTGVSLTPTITDLIPGVYYYRVRATKSTWVDSAQVNGNTSCTMVRTIETPSITVPPSDEDGDLTVTIGASSTPDVTYTVQRSLVSNFSSGVSDVYTGTSLVVAGGTNLDPGTYYFRVFATKATWINSAYSATDSCVMTRTVATPTITVPANDSDGTFNATIGASSTPAVDSYIVERSLSSSFSSGVSVVYTGLSLITPEVASNIDPGTWYYRVKSTKTNWIDSAYSAIDNCVVTRTVATPSITVPASDTDGTFTATIGASSTPGVTSYTVERSTYSNFSSNVSTVYTGLSLTPTVASNLDPGTHYFRVRANKTAWISSGYSAIDSSLVTRTVVTPSLLTIPSSDTDGTFTTTIGASSTPGVTYTVQRSLVSNFSSGVSTVYTGTSLTPTVASNLDPGTYYFRVMATKTAWISSGYRVAGNGCVVTRTVATPTITVPANDSDGTFNATIGASSTPGVTSYTVERCLLANFGSGVSAVYTGLSLTPAVASNLDPNTYYYRVFASKTGWNNSAYSTVDNCIVTRTVVNPTSLSVPASDPDGTFNVTVGASSTPGVTYYLYRANNSGFTGQVLIGTSTGLTFSGGSDLYPGTYYYRVYAGKSGWISSGYTNGNVGCVVTRTVVAPTITVPANDSDGTFTATIGASSTPSVTAYVVERSLVSNFSSGVSVIYTGLSLAPSVASNLNPGTYYYRVKAQKASWVDSAYSAIDNCVVTRTVAAPNYLTVPSSDGDGTITLTIGASSTPGVTSYTVERSPYSNFSSGVVTVYTGLSLAPSISGLSVGTHYFRVKAQRSGWLDSNWRNGNVGCVVTIVSYGDMAVYIGGALGAAYHNTISRQTVSTKSSAVLTSTLSIGEWGAGGCANGTGDISLITFGVQAGTVYTNKLRRGVVSTGAAMIVTATVTERRSTEAASNATGGIACICGRNAVNASQTEIVRVSISTATSATKTGDLTYGVLYPGMTSNGTGDMAVSQSNNYIQRLIVSTGVKYGIVYNLSSARNSTYCMSNGTNDMAIYAGGLITFTFLTTIDKGLISANANSTAIGNLAAKQALGGSVDNGIGNTGIIGGGAAGYLIGDYRDTIQYTTVSTGTSFIMTGSVLLGPRTNLTTACNS